MKLAFNISLAAILLAVMAAVARADPAAGGDVFTANNCGDCHYTEGPAREKTIDDQLAKKGPELWYAGSKFQQEWLSAWLQAPEPIRLLKFNSLTEDNPADHPSLPEGDAANVTEYLMTLTSSDVEAGVIKPKNNPKGRLIFKKKMPCSGCHQYTDRKKLAGGRSGPSLVGAGQRLNPDWIFAYLQNPAAFKPVKMMPVFTDLLSERDMMSVSQFIASFE